MSQSAIRVRSLGKHYRLPPTGGHHTSLPEAVASWVRRPLQRLRAREQGIPGGFWALRDVEFEVPQGEVLGVIGRNGAGKSTLLKLLSRITAPTTGEIEVRGRLASLLEVGTGFHPELSGRENIFLNGAILGMKKQEISRRFDAIVEFSGVERFLDTPVKRYSSGMYTRLAFAVAAHLEPEILLVDEVLAVGDASFQKKCLGKMGEVARDGRTVLFVSHNMQAVSTLTRKCLLLRSGQCVAHGPTEGVITEYLRESGSNEAIYTAPTGEEPCVTRVELKTSEPNNTQRNSEDLEVHFEIFTPRPMRGAALSFQACNSVQQPIMHLWVFDWETPMCRTPGYHRVVCRIPKLRMYMGRYTLTVHLSERDTGQKLQTLEGIVPFEVVMYGQHRDYQWAEGACTYLEEANWEVSQAV